MVYLFFILSNIKALFFAIQNCTLHTIDIIAGETKMVPKYLYIIFIWYSMTLQLLKLDFFHAQVLR